MKSSLVLFVALCVVGASLVSSVDNHFPHAVEPASGVQFPLEMAGEASTLSLAGTAIRVKKILFVNVQVCCLVDNIRMHTACPMFLENT